MKNNPLVIVLTGHMGAGKGEVVKILEQHNFKYITLSQFVRAEAERRGVVMERAILQGIGNDLRTQYGAGVLGLKAKELILDHPDTPWCVDGIRNPAEIHELRQLDNFHLLAVVAPEELLVTRILQRGRPSDPTTSVEIQQRIERELSGAEIITGQRVDLCIAEADQTYNNTGSLADLKFAVEEWLRLLSS